MEKSLEQRPFLIEARGTLFKEAHLYLYNEFATPQKYILFGFQQAGQPNTIGAIIGGVIRAEL